MQKLIGSAIATIYILRDEDFGTSPVESMAAGKPVIGAGERGLLETVIHGETGWLISPNPSVAQLIQAFHEIDPKQAYSMRSARETRAIAFRVENFTDKMQEIIG